MNVLKHLALALCAIAVTFTAYAQEDTKSKKTDKVYIFGVGAAFGDSIVYFTDVQTLEGANLIQKGYLIGRETYSYQLKEYLENNLNLPNRICAVYFSKKKKKIEKIYTKLKKKYENDEAVKLDFTGYGSFTFKEIDN